MFLPYHVLFLLLRRNATFFRRKYVCRDCFYKAEDPQT